VREAAEPTILRVAGHAGVSGGSLLKILEVEYHLAVHPTGLVGNMRADL